MDLSDIHRGMFLSYWDGSCWNIGTVLAVAIEVGTIVILDQRGNTVQVDPVLVELPAPGSFSVQKPTGGAGVGQERGKRAYNTTEGGISGCITKSRSEGR